MSDHLRQSIQRAMLDQARLTAVAIANTRAARRESFLSCLPPRFSSISKANLRGSVMDSRVDKAIAQAEKAASVLFTEAAAKSLFKPKPKTGTSLVEKHQRPSTSYASRPRSDSSQHPSMRPSKSWRSRDSDGPPPKRARGQLSSQLGVNQRLPHSASERLGDFRDRRVDSPGPP